VVFYWKWSSIKVNTVYLHTATNQSSLYTQLRIHQNWGIFVVVVSPTPVFVNASERFEFIVGSSLGDISVVVIIAGGVVAAAVFTASSPASQTCRVTHVPSSSR
jgi:hypothetical protein